MGEDRDELNAPPRNPFVVRFTKRRLLEELEATREQNVALYEHWDTLGDDVKAEVANQQTLRFDYMIELVKADIADEDQMIEEGINE